MQNLLVSGDILEKMVSAGLWFVDVPRTGSTSIKSILAKKFGPVFGKSGNQQGVMKGMIPDHTPAVQIRAAVGDKVWEKLYTFSFVRNPWDRAVSLYLYRTQNNHSLTVPFRNYILSLRQPGKDPESPFSYHGYHFGNWRYVCSEQGQQIVDFVGKFENREADLKIVSQQTGVDYQLLLGEHIGNSERKPYSDYYDDETREIIAEHYARDIELFDYEF